MLALATGCQPDKNDGLEHGEQFANDAVHSVHEFTMMESANATRADATLRSYHFDSTELNSLGEERLELMLRNGQTCNPLTIYLDLPTEDADTSARREAVGAFLKDHGLTDEQIKFNPGPNPNWNSPVAPLIAGTTSGGTGAPVASSGATASGTTAGH